MARLCASLRTSLPVVQPPRNPQPESIARSPYEAIVNSFPQKGKKPGLSAVVQPACDLRGDPTLGGDEGVGAQAFDREGTGHDRLPLAELGKEVGRELVIRLRKLCGPIDPGLHLLTGPSLERAVAVKLLQHGRVLVSGCLTSAVAEQVVTCETELCADEGEHGLRDGLGGLEQL